jgi:hypothetical protein
MDFLSSLVTRSVTTVRAQAAATIQPRIASVFESGGGQGFTEVEEMPGAEPPARSPYRAVPAISTAEPGVPARRRERAPQGPLLKTAEATPELGRLPERSVPLPAQAVPNQASDEIPEQAAMGAALLASPAFETQRPQPDPVERQADRDAAEFIREISVPLTLVADRALAQPAEMERQSAHVAGRAAPPARVVGSRRLLRNNKGVPETPYRVQESPPIQVTIGRVEVRATTPLPSAPRRTGPQGMTIDQYLRKRTSGGSQ